MVALATTLTAIDLKKYRVFSMICYIGMGWAIIFFAKQAMQALTFPGFLLLLLGGIAYTVGSVLYGLGKRRKWMHSVFHIFVVLGALLQFFCVLFYAVLRERVDGDTSGKPCASSGKNCRNFGIQVACCWQYICTKSLLKTAFVCFFNENQKDTMAFLTKVF